MLRPVRFDQSRTALRALIARDCFHRPLPWYSRLQGVAQNRGPWRDEDITSTTFRQNQKTVVGTECVQAIVPPPSPAGTALSHWFAPSRSLLLRPNATKSFPAFNAADRRP